MPVAVLCAFLYDHTLYGRTRLRATVRRAGDGDDGDDMTACETINQELAACTRHTHQTIQRNVTLIATAVARFMCTKTARFPSSARMECSGQDNGTDGAYSDDVVVAVVVDPACP